MDIATILIEVIVRIEFSPLVQIGASNRHYWPRETTDEGSTWINARTCSFSKLVTNRFHRMLCLVLHAHRYMKYFSIFDIRHWKVDSSTTFLRLNLTRPLPLNVRAGPWLSNICWRAQNFETQNTQIPDLLH